MGDRQIFLLSCVFYYYGVWDESIFAYLKRDSFSYGRASTGWVNGIRIFACTVGYDDAIKMVVRWFSP